MTNKTVNLLTNNWKKIMNATTSLNQAIELNSIIESLADATKYRETKTIESNIDVMFDAFTKEALPLVKEAAIIAEVSFKGGRYNEDVSPYKLAKKVKAEILKTKDSVWDSYASSYMDRVRRDSLVEIITICATSIFHNVARGDGINAVDFSIRNKEDVVTSCYTYILNTVDGSLVYSDVKFLMSILERKVQESGKARTKFSNDYDIIIKEIEEDSRLEA